MRPRTDLTPILAALPLCALLAVVVTGWKAYTPFSDSVVTPDLRGALLVAARSTASRDRLQIRVLAEKYNDAYASNIVFDQVPPPGQRVAPDTILAVVISRGPETVPVPDVRSHALAEASTMLSGGRLAIGKIAWAVAQARAGVVLSQEPRAGAVVRPGSAIDLVLSAGPPAPPLPPPQPEKTVGPEVQSNQTRGD